VNGITGDPPFHFPWSFYVPENPHTYLGNLIPVVWQLLLPTARKQARYTIWLSNQRIHTVLFPT